MLLNIFHEIFAYKKENVSKYYTCLSVSITVSKYTFLFSKQYSYSIYLCIYWLQYFLLSLFYLFVYNAYKSSKILF